MPPRSKPPTAKQLAAMAAEAVAVGKVPVTRCPTAAAAWTTGQNIDFEILKRIAEGLPPRTLADTIKEGIVEFQSRRKRKSP